MQYRANPVHIEAHRIVSVGPEVIEQIGVGTFTLPVMRRHLALENGENVHATAEMLSRMTPEAGDYWVIQEDGYTYLNPRAVFERKYSLIPQLAEK